MSTFKSLFEHYGYTVEQLTDNSFIADNGVFCVPYTEYKHTPNSEPYISAVSFLSCDKNKVMEFYRKEKAFNEDNNSSLKVEIGFETFSAFMNNRLDRHGLTPHGGICNHDHSVYEIESVLKRSFA